MNNEERIFKELESVKKGGNLYKLALAFKQEGMGQKEMTELFYSASLQEEDNEDGTKHNAILDTMDFISGYCREVLRIFKDDEL